MFEGKAESAGCMRYWTCEETEYKPLCRHTNEWRDPTVAAFTANANTSNTGKVFQTFTKFSFTCNLIGRIPSTTRRSNKDWAKPALAAFLHITTGPSWQWSPTSINWRKKSPLSVKTKWGNKCTAKIKMSTWQRPSTPVCLELFLLRNCSWIYSENTPNTPLVNCIRWRKRKTAAIANLPRHFFPKEASCV